MIATAHGSEVSRAGSEISRAFSSRLADSALSGGNAAAHRLVDLVSRLHLLVGDLKPSPDEMRAAIAFLT